MSMNKVKNFIHNNRMAIGSIVLFSTVILVLGLPYSGWGFEFDDCGILYGSKASCWYDVVEMFRGLDHFVLTWPSNYYVHSQSFFNVYYRPLCRVLFTPQLAIFGFHPYGYFLVMVVLHAANAVALFYTTYFITNAYWLSLWTASFFAVHMSIGSWMGWIAAQNYPAALLLVLLSLLSFFSYLKHKRLGMLALATVSFLGALFMFEFVIFFPIVVTGLWLVRKFFPAQCAIVFPSFSRYCVSIAPFWVALGFFFGVRMALYPVAFAGSGNVNNGIAAITNFLQLRSVGLYADITSFLADFGNVAWLSSGHFFLKMCIAGFFFMVLGMLWLSNRYKIVVVFLLLCMIPAVWPMMLKYYRGRYAYFALPLFVTSVAMLLRYSTWYEIKKHWTVRLSCWLVLIGLLVVNGVYTMNLLQKREVESVRMFSAYKKLAALPEIKGRKVCFIGVPVCFRTCLAQALWLQGINSDLPIYYDHQTFTHGSEGDENSIAITPIPKGFHLVVNNPTINWFSGLGDDCSMGAKHVLAYHAANNAPTEMDYVFDDKYLQQDVLFITWDYTKGQFKVLETKPLV